MVFIEGGSVYDIADWCTDYDRSVLNNLRVMGASNRIGQKAVCHFYVFGTCYTWYFSFFSCLIF
jgi:hypothetical protein